MQLNRYPMLMFLILSGCWVRMPSNRPDMHDHVGDVAVVERKLYLYQYVDYSLNLNREASDLYDPTLFGSTTRIEAQIRPGTELRVVGVVLRRLPPGAYYYYVCQLQTGGHKFDLPQELESSLNFVRGATTKK
jgi:hypothetical protein